MVVILNTGKKAFVPIEALPELYSLDNSQRRNYSLLSDGEVVSWDSLGIELKADDILRHAD